MSTLHPFTKAATFEGLGLATNLIVCYFHLDFLHFKYYDAAYLRGGLKACTSAIAGEPLFLPSFATNQP